MKVTKMTAVVFTSNCSITYQIPDMKDWGRIHNTHLSATFSLKYGKLPLKLRVSLMFQGLHLSIKGFTYLVKNSLNFLRFKGKT